MRLPALVLLALSLLACASFDPLNVRKDLPVTDLSTPHAVLPGREVFRYSATWNGFPAGRAELRFTRVADELRSEGDAETTGLVSLIYGVAVRARGTARIGDGRSRSWGYETDGGDPEKEIEARFDPGTGKITCRVRKGDGREKRILVAPEAHDPFGCIYCLRVAELEPGRVLRSDVFTEWYLYRTDLVVDEPETIRLPAGTFPAVPVRLEVRKLVNGEPEGEAHGGAIWFTNDGKRMPVRIEADTKYGRVTLKLNSFEVDWPEVSSGRGTR